MTMKLLVYIPVIHTAVEMGSMAETLKTAYFERFGEEQWASHLKAIEQMWDGLQRKIEALELEYSNTKLYQDGLPICGRELEIVTEVAERGSHNHQILLELVKKGCTLMGTESQALLVQEYRNLQQALQRRGSPTPVWKVLWSRWTAQRLLHQRDRFIAQRITDTLGPGETGLLFMGIQHEVDRYLPRGVSVEYLFHRLPFQYTSRFATAA
ncbi:MAG: hypothetical protein HYZ73_02665 [Elusimicrobia bacterium]|nr:hypothetical protein [Elusimicrobiota bacterium]